MGSGKTTLLHHLFGMAPPGLYTSTGVAEQSLRGLLHHMVQRLSAGAWKRLSYQDIRKFLAPLIRAGMREADVDSLATQLMRSIDPLHVANPSSLPAPTTSVSFPESQPEESHTGKGMVPLAEALKHVCYQDISKFLAPLIRFGMRQADVDSLATKLMHSIDPLHVVNPSSLPAPTTSVSFPESQPEESHTGKGMVPLAEALKRVCYQDIRKFLAPLIWVGMRQADVDSLATQLMRSIDPLHVVNPSSLPAPTTPVSLPEKSHTGKEMVPLVKSAPPMANVSDLVLELVHMIDTGGQPELMEVMPSLIHNANLAIVLVDLRYGLNERPPVSYNEAGVCHKHGLPSQYTGRDVVLKLVSTLHAKRSLNEAFRLLIIATHRDCVEKDLDSRVKALNDELRSLLLPTFEEELILFKTSDNKIAFVLDLKSPGTSDRDSLEVIRTEVGKPSLGRTFKTPASFFVFEQDLLQFAKNVAKRDILSLDECRQVGARLIMSSEVVETALVFFHCQNTFLYFRHVLPNHVFVNPQVPFDVVNGIVRFSYKVSAGEVKGFTAKFVSQFKGGVITQELLSYDKISSHFQEGFYEIKDAIKLLCYTFILAPLKPYSPKGKVVPVDEKKKEYLMMCLKQAFPDDKLYCHIPKSSETVPLVIKFSSGCVPLGCFGSTISCLLSKYGWEVIRKDECLAHNIASLHDPKLKVNLILIDFNKHLQIHINSSLNIRKSPADICSQVRCKVTGAIEKVFKIMHLDTEKIKTSYCFLSTCPETSEKRLAVFEESNGEHILCCECCKSVIAPSKKQLLWIGVNDWPLKKDDIQDSSSNMGLDQPPSVKRPKVDEAAHKKSQVSHNPQQLHLDSSKPTYSPFFYQRQPMYQPYYNYPQHPQLLPQLFHNPQRHGHFPPHSLSPPLGQPLYWHQLPHIHPQHQIPVTSSSSYPLASHTPAASDYLTSEGTTTTAATAVASQVPQHPPLGQFQPPHHSYFPYYYPPPPPFHPPHLPPQSHGESHLQLSQFQPPVFQSQSQPPQPPSVIQPQLYQPPHLPPHQSNQQELTDTPSSSHSPAAPSGPLASATPIVLELLKFPKRNGGYMNIIQEISTNYRSLGTFLLCDETGAITKGIIATEKGETKNINYAILTRWLQGMGRSPQTWKTLVTVLDEAGLKNLASTISENLQCL